VTLHSKPGLRLCRASLDEDDITILDNVVLALGHDLALRLDGSLITLFPQHAVVVHNDLDERLLKVTMDDTGSLRCLGAVAQRPLPNLVGTGCEKAAEVECLAHGDDDLGKDRLGADDLLLFNSLLVRHGGQALLVCDGDGNDWVAGSVLLDPLGNLGQMLVLLADEVLLAEVDQEDDGLGGKEE
jgi:hypothetical protein